MLWLCSVSLDHLSCKVYWERAAQHLCKDCLVKSARGKWSQLLSCCGGFSTQIAMENSIELLSREGDKTTASEQQQ